MRVIIDFDYTIFDTEAFRIAMIACLQPYGVTDALYRETENQFIHTDGKGLYQFEQHLALLAHNTGVVVSTLRAQTEIIFQQMADFIFPDAVQFLQQIPDEKIILSYGELNWQTKKINASGVMQWVNKYVVTNGAPKTEYIEPLIVSGQTVFIDDRGSEIDAIKAHFPEVFCVWLHRMGTPYYDEECTGADSIAPKLSTNILNK